MLTYIMLSEAVVELRRNSTMLTRKLLLPMIGLIAVTSAHYLIWSSPSMLGAFLSWMATLPFYVMIAVICHRGILLGEQAIPSPRGLFWTPREWRFLLWLIRFGILFFLIFLPIGILMGMLLPDWFEDEYAIPVYLFFLTISAYFEGRFGLVFPSIAVEEDMGFGQAWAATRGIGLSLAFALMIPPLIAEMIDYFVISALFEDSPLVWEIFDTLLYVPVVILGVAVITVTYRNVVSVD